MTIRVGIIGGGQLAWMMAKGAQKLGIELVVQTPSQQDPAVSIATDTVLGGVADAAITAKLARQVDVITFENEFVDLEALRSLEQTGVRFYPPLSAIEPVLDKLHQRTYFANIGVPTPSFRAVAANSSLEELSELGFPVVLKARRHGYDGYGTFVCKSLVEVQQAMQSASGQTWLLEAFVPFERELAVMAARSPQGDIAVYPVVETVQDAKTQVCRIVYATGEWQDGVTQQVRAIAHNLLTSLNYVGVMGIELFLTAQQTVLVNEIAPRTHNSGHYTLDACTTSQFEQQLRAVTGMDLGSPDLTTAGAVMVNLLGFESSDSDYADKRQQLAAIPQAHVYWYGKAQSRLGRKLGHVTVLLESHQTRADAEAIAHQIETLWYPQG
ncbi:5-(carboxyamino)imidazole ribonucleotide synthase [Leptolyngbya sp. AN02str]|uniref:5-(carboxyamino)imidazole ribonucleotide synthase n=1 Tax=Leptolyngbya sp. AN02str TaxID=3423363 RepID=UPI003D31D6A4